MSTNKSYDQMKNYKYLTKPSLHQQCKQKAY